MKKFTFIASFLLMLFYFYQPLSAQKLSFTAGPFFMVGDNSEYADVGYSLGLGMEFKIHDNIGIELAPSYSSIYYEFKSGFMGVYVDNYIYSLRVIPHIYIPLPESRIKFVLSPEIGYSHVVTQADIYYLNLVDTYYGWDVSEINMKKDYNKNKLVYGFSAGIDVYMGRNIDILVSAGYENMDLGNDMNDMGYNTYSSNNINISTSSIAVNLGLKYGL